MIIFPDVRRISSKKSHGLHKICHNSRKNSKLKEGKLETQVKKLKPEGKNSRFRQNQKRGLPKIGRKKRAEFCNVTFATLTFRDPEEIQNRDLGSLTKIC